MLWILVLAILLIVILLVWGMLVAHSRIDEILQEMGQFVYYPVEYPKGGCAPVIGDSTWKDKEREKMGASGLGEAMVSYVNETLPENWEELRKEERKVLNDWEINGDDLG